MRRRTIISGLLLATLSACIVVPVPTPEWGGDEPITREQFETLENGIGLLTEDDVVEMLGVPQRRYADGRVLVYEWVRNQGLWIVGGMYWGDIAAGESAHRLCLLFSSAGVLDATRHIDSALGMADAQLANQLEEWLGAAARLEEAPGYARRLDSEAFSLTPRAGQDVGVMLVTASARRPACWHELDDLAAGGYRFYTHEQLRDDFYPWLEPPWTGKLDTLSSSPDLSSARKETGLRFIIVVAERGDPMAGTLCDARNRFAVGCYTVDFRDHGGRVAVLDLERHAATGRSGALWIIIPEFPTSRREACRALMAYAMDDVQRLLGQ